MHQRPSQFCISATPCPAVSCIICDSFFPALSKTQPRRDCISRLVMKSHTCNFRLAIRSRSFYTLSTSPLPHWTAKQHQQTSKWFDSIRPNHAQHKVAAEGLYSESFLFHRICFGCSPPTHQRIVRCLLYGYTFSFLGGVW